MYSKKFFKVYGGVNQCFIEGKYVVFRRNECVCVCVRVVCVHVRVCTCVDVCEFLVGGTEDNGLR